MPSQRINEMVEMHVRVGLEQWSCEQGSSLRLNISEQQALESTQAAAFAQ